MPDPRADADGDSNKAIVARFFDDVFNRQDTTVARAIISPDFVAHHPTLGDIRGPAALGQMAATFRTGFPDLCYAIDDSLADGDRVATRWTATGTHKGVFYDINATNKQVRVTGTDIFRIADAQLVEAWVNSDFFGLFEQLGQFPRIAGKGGTSNA